MIIALTGYKGSGKDTVSDFLVSNYGYTRIGFADPMREVAKILFGWSEENFTQENKEKIDPYYGLSPRQFLMDFGTDVFQYHYPNKYPEFKRLSGRGFWAKRVEKIILDNPTVNYVISDLRFPHEEAMIRKHQSSIWRINRDSVVPSDLSLVHESESHISSIQCEHVLINNSDKESLYNKIDFAMDWVIHPHFP